VHALAQRRALVDANAPQLDKSNANRGAEPAR